MNSTDKRRMTNSYLISARGWCGCLSFRFSVIDDECVPHSEKVLLPKRYGWAPEAMAKTNKNTSKRYQYLLKYVFWQNKKTEWQCSIVCFPLLTCFQSNQINFSPWNWSNRSDCGALHDYYGFFVSVDGNLNLMNDPASGDFRGV